MGSINVKFKWQGYDHLEKALQSLGGKAPYALARATDEVGNKTFTLMKRAVAAQTGAPYGRVSSVMSKQLAMGAGKGTFIIIARDVTMSLKEFNPVQTKRGIKAGAWGVRKLYAHTFFGPGGHVYKNTHKWNKESRRYNAIQKEWGPNIPKEMVKDQAEATFYAYTAVALPAAIEKWVFRLLD
jgi:hypothetical protein